MTAGEEQRETIARIAVREFFDLLPEYAPRGEVAAAGLRVADALAGAARQPATDDADLIAHALTAEQVAEFWDFDLSAMAVRLRLAERIAEQGYVVLSRSRIEALLIERDEAWERATALAHRLDATEALSASAPVQPTTLDRDALIEYLTSGETASVAWLKPNRDPDLTLDMEEAADLADYILAARLVSPAHPEEQHPRAGERADTNNARRCVTCGSELLVDRKTMRSLNVFCPNDQCAAFAQSFWVNRVGSTEQGGAS